MKKKIISFIGLALFVGAILFNVQMTNSNKQSNEVILENIEVIAGSGDSGSCVWGGDESCPLWDDPTNYVWDWQTAD